MATFRAKLYVYLKAKRNTFLPIEKLNISSTFLAKRANSTKYMTPDMVKRHFRF